MGAPESVIGKGAAGFFARCHALLDEQRHRTAAKAAPLWPEEPKPAPLTAQQVVFYRDLLDRLLAIHGDAAGLHYAEHVHGRDDLSAQLERLSSAACLAVDAMYRLVAEAPAPKLEPVAREQAALLADLDRIIFAPKR